MELRIKASDQECMEYALENLKDLTMSAKGTGSYRLSGSFSGIDTSVVLINDIVSIECIRR